MAKVKLNLRQMTIPEKVRFAEQVAKAMEGNPIFPSPDPNLDEIKNAAADLQASYDSATAARQTSEERTSIMEQKETTLDAILSKEANYVENKSNGDEAIILSSGMSTRAKPVPATSIGMATDVSLSTGDRDGELFGRWNRVDGAKAYIGEISPDPPTPTSWKQAGVVTNSSMTITGLVSGTKY